MKKTTFNVKFANLFVFTMVTISMVCLFFMSRQAAWASTEGPCPTFENFSTPCPEYSHVYRVPAGYACAQGDPVFANGSEYYHCCIYDVFNKHCYSMNPPLDTINGQLYYLNIEAGPGLCTQNSDGSYTCLAY